ncbi:TetR/AcrR family transcriptional regulator [Allonocardiopsis opalescens]|uniref:TetR family transcriptional regulator n=1 Tax=Allonocardiopsis opalescens TaxID=1144618 RepID=A0A2T0QEE8_9ACTN|nr:TetR/AcrR family transcriptional regulator [Allonocardiopsis opalescens]PRY02299.1 TetR family transcriptional regulator [Allonocardiopsis opalescens]
MTVGTPGPRARYRERTRAEIKEIALRQLAEGGIGSVALTRIAKELGLSGPALYRYFAGRDDLLSALILDAYADVARTVGESGAAEEPARARLRALARAYRGWALGEPHRHLLIYGSPLPGYTAPPETLRLARDALAPFVGVFADARPAPAAAAVAGQLADWARRDAAVAQWAAECLAGGAGGASADAERAGRALAGAVTAWTRLYGVVGLEVIGQFTTMGHDPLSLLDAEMDLLADAYGLP